MPCRLSDGKHNLNQCEDIVNWTTLQWNLNQNTENFFQENAFENIFRTRAISSVSHATVTDVGKRMAKQPYTCNPLIRLIGGVLLMNQITHEA